MRNCFLGKHFYRVLFYFISFSLSFILGIRAEFSSLLYAFCPFPTTSLRRETVPIFPFYFCGLPVLTLVQQKSFNSFPPFLNPTPSYHPPSLIPFPFSQVPSIQHIHLFGRYLLEQRYLVSRGLVFGRRVLSWLVFAWGSSFHSSLGGDWLSSTPYNLSYSSLFT